tara:strand:- start:628 stop:1521 length:894 start_codon:yes stop_codon:yes gene_type:complete
MKIGYFADGLWGHNAFDLMTKNKDLKILFVCARFDNSDQRLKELSTQEGIDFITEKNINSPKFIEKLKRYNCDIFISMSFNQIFKKETYTIPTIGTINCHAGKLPFYRGRNILNWVLINDEKEFGITVHFVNEGIDTGDILLQKTFPINDNDSYKTLLEKAYIECPKLLLNAINLIKENNFLTRKQSAISKSFMYCSKRIEGDEIINWNSNSREIFNFIRALTLPGPCAITYIGNKKIKLLNSIEISNAPVYKGIPGGILEFGDGYFLVKTKDTYIKIIDWESEVRLSRGLRFQEKR